jgi:glycosyltransferase involved in cell wall biosynthesis
MKGQSMIRRDGRTKNLPSLSFITTCKGRLTHLVQSLPRLSALPGVQVILVDSMCPDGAGDWAETNLPTVTVVRHHDGGVFNAGRARNAGAQVAEAPRLCFIDADVLIAPRFLRTVMARARPGRFLTILETPQNLGIPGTCIVSRRDFALVEGYDECFLGWGGEDRDLYTRLGWAGIAHEILPVDVIEKVLQHPDSERSRFHEVKNIAVSQTIAAVYRSIKYDAYQATGHNLSLDERRRLYATCFNKICEGLNAGASVVRVELQLPPPPEVKFLWAQARRTVSYEIDLRTLPAKPRN